MKAEIRCSLLGVTSLKPGTEPGDKPLMYWLSLCEFTLEQMLSGLHEQLPSHRHKVKVTTSESHYSPALSTLNADSVVPGTCGKLLGGWSEAYLPDLGEDPNPHPSAHSVRCPMHPSGFIYK